MLAATLSAGPAVLAALLQGVTNGEQAALPCSCQTCQRSSFWMFPSALPSMTLAPTTLSTLTENDSLPSASGSPLTSTSKAKLEAPGAMLAPISDAPT
jgi:hypothetical protein